MLAYAARARHDAGDMGRPRVLVTGASGFLGGFAVAAMRRRADVVTLSRTNADLCVDLTDARAMEAALATARADAVLHLAAMARMPACAKDPDGAQAINARVPGELAASFGRRFLYVSTDLVFDGRRAPYRAADPVAPLSVYGQTKAEGEERVLAAGGRVVRISLLCGPDDRGRCASAMVRAAIAARQPVTLFTNEYRTPLHAADAARSLADWLLRDGGPALCHLAGPERLSRWEFGQRLCRAHSLPTDLLLAAECQDASRPRDVSLVSDLPQRPLAEMLAEC
jgi:dTDP-4-dehydrorhamnose reductase